MGMSVNMDGVRIGIANDFNDVCKAVSKLSDESEKAEVIEKLQVLRQSIGVLNCIREPSDKHFNYLLNLELYDFEEKED